MVSRNIKSPHKAYIEALNGTSSLSIDELRVIASKDSTDAYLFAVNIDKKPHQVTIDGVISSLEISYNYMDKLGLIRKLRSKLVTSDSYALDVAFFFDKFPKIDTRNSCNKSSTYSMNYNKLIDKVPRVDIPYHALSRFEDFFCQL